MRVVHVPPARGKPNTILCLPLPGADLPLELPVNSSTIWRGFLRNDANPSARLIVPTSTLYVKHGSSGGGGGLSVGAVVGIAVGCCAAGLLVAALAVYVVRRRRKQARGLAQLPVAVLPNSKDLSSKITSSIHNSSLESGPSMPSGGIAELVQVRARAGVAACR